jgi:hypothetical protein
LVPVPVPVPDPDIFSTVFNLYKIFAFAMLEAALFPRKLASMIFELLHFILCWTGFKSGFGMHYGSGSAKAKSCGSYGSCSCSTTWEEILGKKGKGGGEEIAAGEGESEEKRRE